MKFITEENEKELKVYEALKQVIDPEVGINIIDLGLVYRINYKAVEGIKIEMTLSTRACPMGDIIRQSVEECSRTVFPEEKVTVEFVWEPQWQPEFITPAGKEALKRS